MPKQLAFISILQMQRAQTQTPAQETMHLFQPKETHEHSTFTTKLETSQAFFIIIKKHKSLMVYSLYMLQLGVHPRPPHIYTLTGNKSQH